MLSRFCNTGWRVLLFAKSTHTGSTTSCNRRFLSQSSRLNYRKPFSASLIRGERDKKQPEGFPEKDDHEKHVNSEENDKSNEQPIRKTEETASSQNDTTPQDGEEDGEASAGSIPEVYPQLMVLPIMRRPLFPGFYKAVVTKNPVVSAAIKELVKKRQPYIGAFLLRDEDKDTDVITDIKQVYPVGVFAQITSIFPAKNAGENALTAVLYPHRRIRITELIPPKSTQEAVKANVKDIENEQQEETKEEEEPEQPHQSAEDSTALLPNKDEQSLLVPDENTPGGTPPSTSSSVPKNDYLPLQNASAILKNFNVSLVKVQNIPKEPYDRQDPVIKAVTSEIVNVFKDIANLNPLFRDQIANFSISQSTGNVFDEPEKLADFAAAVSSGELDELQQVLEASNVADRLQKALFVLKKELFNAQLQSKISKDVDQKINQRQKEFYLMEQLKGIKRELGLETDGKEALVTKFRERTKDLRMPPEVEKVFNEELSKFQHLEPVASEFNVTRNYLDWLTELPWGRKTTENFNLERARTILDEDHFGLKDVKDRILELVAVGKLRGTMQGKIICLVGPPGVGKTSIGRSIARSLNREFYRFSVGGLTDVAEIKGHRRTYVGAMPGKVIQALKKVQTENPLILIDEIDKVGKSHQGDPASALLELLDPEQNSAFVDHYMDVPVNLSSVLFVCTANTLDTIPAPLLDRMEVIELSGYVLDEKINIAKGYLIPQAKEACGLKDTNINITDGAIKGLIRYYCHESGVRNLKKQIEKIFRKMSFNIVKKMGEEKLPEEAGVTKEGSEALEAQSEQVSEHATSFKPRVPIKIPEVINLTITDNDLKDYLGPATFLSDRLYDITPAGVVMGLAWTRLGGATLYVESIVKNKLTSSSQPSLERTGQLGDVMKESSLLAYSYVRSLVAKRFPDNQFFQKAQIHLHCPEGAVPKDGPSAGITMATSLLSLALNMPVAPDIAMTGELTLTGRILRIGGLREKAVAAKLSNVKKIIFPKDNLSDWEELPPYVKVGLEGYPVEWYEQMFDIVFPTATYEKCNSLWPELLKEDTVQKSSRVTAVVN
ncbi:lon protease Lon1 [Schizosaccharomyces japonicus yFS275]|uniref:Lon protease homolog, mitochondrial n=1 Tax=Schizosaccharomyces japonicus (strain yFS275 / FY16936) TaxID=402676 RepID=B6JX56_SCHJY|nr:lon protease Lon1 [Schizosaccharomyces japonicus yFS275]EEB05957.1 lon protease Lon1 [Schizosaccharomyces japonicus yFS275]